MATPSLTPVSSGPISSTGAVSVEEYHQLIDSGSLPEDGQYELLSGRIVRKMAKHPPHVLVNDQTAEALTRVLPEGWYVRTQNPITLSTSEPEPDVAVLAGSKQDYRYRHPGPENVALVVEIAESSPATDRQKGAIYSEGGIGVYWIVNLLSDCVEVLTQPQGEDETACYAQISTYVRGQHIPLSIREEAVAEIAVDDLLP